MFKKSDSYRQYALFGLTNTLSDRQTKMMKDSIENSFLENIFSKINENDFKVLYSEKKSRPNVPVNKLVGSLILKHLFNWTYEELFRNLNFNILTRHAIGIDSIDEIVFSEASIFNFQNKVIDYFIKSGKDLLTEVFDKLTASQLQEFGIRTDIQRGDSFLIGSNILDYTRLQLLIEMLLRLYRILDNNDKLLFSEILEVYTKQTSGQYIYKIQKENLPKEIDKLAKIYHKIYEALECKYLDVSVFEIFKRVYNEHFTIIEDKAQVIPSNKLNSSILMSPDDVQATYRDKRNRGNKGYSGHISETANPENEINIITDIALTPNNVDDAKILEERLPEMINKTPELNEYHNDCNYASPAVDKLMEQNNIMQIQNAVRGRKAYAKITITEIKKGEYWVKCEQGQIVKAEKATKGKNAKRYKAIFDYYKCLQCPLNEKCRSKAARVKINRPIRTWYFSEEKIRLHKRKQNIYLIPEERRKIRANVEASVKEVKRGIKNDKVRIRGRNRIMIYLSMTTIAVNLTRIHKFLSINPFCYSNATSKGVEYCIIKLIFTIEINSKRQLNQRSQILLTQNKIAA